MSDLDNRGDAFEKKFAHDQDLQFKVEARCCKLVGLWIAEKLGMTDASIAEAYAKEVVISNLEEVGLDDVKRKITADLDAKSIDVPEADIDEKLTECMTIAKTQIMEETE